MGVRVHVTGALRRRIAAALVGAAESNEVLGLVAALEGVKRHVLRVIVPHAR